MATPAQAHGRPARVTKRRAHTRQRLLDAAFEVFAERGFGRATVDNVCSAAGYTRGAFYSNFSSLDEVFLALYEQRADRLAQQVTAALAGPSPAGGPTVDLPALVDKVLAALPPDPRWYCVTAEFFAYALRHPEVARALAAQRRSLRQALAPALAAAAESLDLPPAVRDPDLLARTLAAVHEATTEHLLLEPGEPALRAWQRNVLMLALGATMSHPVEAAEQG